MSRTTRTMWFLTTGFYNEKDEYQNVVLRGYSSKDCALAVCGRLMKWQIDHTNWEVACKNYLDAHPELLAIPMRNNLYPKIRHKLRTEWEKANPFTTTAKRHDDNYFVTEVPIKII